MQFDFGKNWADFSERALTPERVAAAQRDFAALMEGVPLADRTFLDIGFGQGLSLLTAASSGVRLAVGCDINPTCAQVLYRNRVHFPQAAGVPVVVGSVLAEDTVEMLRRLVDERAYDVVHSWGVLHHTGDMRRAIRTAASLVRPGGTLVLALYHRHWTSRPWWYVKWIYNRLPAWARPALVWGLLPVIWLGAYATTGAVPTRKERGMSFYHDVVDWVGGYPYEYATPAEVEAWLAELGFTSRRVIPTAGFTGCNQFVFERRPG